MKSRTLRAALRIALIVEEFSEDEITEAVFLLEKQAHTSNLFSYLSNNTSRQDSPLADKQSSTRGFNRTSDAVLAFETSDPEKFELLSRFEFSLQKGKFLSSINEVRKFGESLSKDFPTKGSRKELVNQIIKLLAKYTTQDIKAAIKQAVGYSSPDESYQQLANFIIAGRSSEHSENDPSM